MTSVPDPRVTSKRVRLPIPCGKCAACLTNKRNDWATRLRIELKHAKTAHFITLTYTDDNLLYADHENEKTGIITTVPVLNVDDTQKFMKRLRKKNKNKLKYFLCGEYGEKFKRPHYHMIIFNIDKKFRGQSLEKLLLETWGHGLVHIGSVTPASIRYTTNYMIQKQDMKGFPVQPFATMSRGLGLSYISKMKSYHQKDISRNYVTFEDGQKSRLPRYLRAKLYTKLQRDISNSQESARSDERDEKDKREYSRKSSSNYFQHKRDAEILYTKRINEKIKSNSKL